MTDTPMKMPSREDQRRCFDLRCRSKRGEYSSPENMRFCERMNRRFPEWYAATEANVFNATVPFGSQVKRPTTLPDPC